MADSEERRTLNHDCLCHIFQYLTPKEWIPFIKVNETWKLAAVSKEFERFSFDLKINAKYFHTFVDDDPEGPLPPVDVIKFFDFIQILSFVAPKLKYAKIETHTFEKKKVQYVIVRFGRFEYPMRVNKIQEKILMYVLVKRAKSLETLKINTFEGATKLEWEHFFQANHLNYFKFFSRSPDDHRSFFHDYISMLPNNLEKIALILNRWTKNSELQKILQFLQRQTRLSNLKLLSANDISSIITKEVSKHENTIKELCLLQQVEEFFAMLEDDLKRIIPNFINTKLSLFGLTLWNDEYKKIAENCRSIQSLKLLNSYFLETVLMSLPNLTELHIYPMKINFQNEVTNLRKLSIICDENQEIDYDNFASALAMMPNLSHLTWNKGIIILPDTAARKIKRIIHSRGQDIVVYELKYRYCFFKPNTVKIGRIPREETDSKKEFAFHLNATNGRRMIFTFTMV